MRERLMVGASVLFYRVVRLHEWFLVNRACAGRNPADGIAVADNRDALLEHPEKVVFVRPDDKYEASDAAGLRRLSVTYDSADLATTIAAIATAIAKLEAHVEAMEVRLERRIDVIESVVDHPSMKF